MRVTLQHPREFQDAGVIRTLLPGEHDLPDVVACALIASGAAIRVMVAPERAVAGPREWKKSRRVA